MEKGYIYIDQQGYYYFKPCYHKSMDEEAVLKAHKYEHLDSNYGWPDPSRYDPVYYLGMYLHSGFRLLRGQENLFSPQCQYEEGDYETYEGIPSDVHILLAYSLLVTCDEQEVKYYMTVLECMRNGAAPTKERLKKVKERGEVYLSPIWDRYPYSSQWAREDEEWEEEE